MIGEQAGQTFRVELCTNARALLLYGGREGAAREFHPPFLPLRKTQAKVYGIVRLGRPKMQDFAGLGQPYFAVFNGWRSSAWYR